MVRKRGRVGERVVEAWRTWTAPSPSLTDPTLRWRARLLASLMLAGVPLTGLVLVMHHVLGSTHTITSTRLLSIPLVGMSVAYLLARSRRWRLGAWLASAAISGVAALDLEMHHGAYVVVFVGLAITLGGMVLRKRDTQVMVLVALAWWWIRPLWGEQAFSPVEKVMVSVFFVTLGLVLGASIGLRESIEARRLDQLAKSEDRYRGLLEVAFEGFVVLKDDRIVECNPGFLELCGRNRSELLGRELSAVLDLDDAGEERNLDSTGVMPSTARHQRYGLREASGTRPDGEVFHVELVGRTQLTDRGFVRYVAVRDITERRQATLRLSIAHRAVALGTLSAGIAREINNPLSWMMTNLQMAQDELRGGRADDERLSPTEQGLLRTIDDALQGGRRVMSIVRDLKTLTRDGSDGGVADVHAALDLACRIVSRRIEARARLVRDYGHVPSVAGSAGRLGQVFLNLLVNAIEAIPEGHRDRHRILLRTRSKGDQVEIVVRDDGRGIASADLPHVFDPFFTTTTSDDAGLGLSVARSIVDGLGGSITVESLEGEGTTFVVQLRAADRPAQVQPSAAAGSTRIGRAEPAAPRADARVRVLLIDDETLLGRSLCRALREYEVVFTESPARALELCSETDFDVIVCDLMMPAISGEDVYRHLQERAPEMAARMIFMTGGAFTEGMQRFLAAVDNPVLIKPFSPQDLRVAVRRMVDSMAAQAG